MEVSGQLDTPAALFMKKHFLVQGNGGLQSWFELSGEENSRLSLLEIEPRLLFHPVRSRITTPNELS
jgi:hypothetical protein